MHRKSSAVSSQAPGAGFAASPFRMCFVNCYLSTSLSCFLSYKTRLGLKVSFLNWEKPRRRRQTPIVLVANFWKCWVNVLLLWLTHFQLFATPGLQHARLLCLSSSPRVCSNSCPLSQLYHPAISSSVTLCSSVSQHQCLFQWAGSSHQVARVLELQLQHQSFQWIFMFALL